MLVVFTMKSLLAEKLTKSEFEQTLGFFLMDPEVSSIASGFSFDELYRVYSDYYFKIKIICNNLKGIGVSVKSKDGLDTEYLLYLAENPLLVMGLLNSIELELLLNQHSPLKSFAGLIIEYNLAGKCCRIIAFCNLIKLSLKVTSSLYPLCSSLCSFI